jgi:hypothetical protein
MEPKTKKHKVEAKEPEEKLVSVEMTEEQKKKFADFMIAEEDKVEEAAPVTPEAKKQMRLVFQHRINNWVFGPGIAQVPESYVGLIIHGEQSKANAELKLHTSTQHASKLLQVLK